MKKLTFLLIIQIGWSQTPSLQTFLATEATNRSVIYSRIQGRSFPVIPVGAQFLAASNIYCGQNQPTSSCVFSLAQMESIIDRANAMGITQLTINIDPYNWVANSSDAQGHRALFDSLFNTTTGYILTYPNMRIVLNPSFISNNLGSACRTLTGTTNNPMQSPVDLDTCMKTNASWLGGQSVYAYLASQYCAILKRFTVVHEPTSINSNYTKYYASWSGTPAQWTTFATDMISIVSSACATCTKAIAFDRFELSPTNYQATMIGATGLQEVGYDDYTTDIGNTTNGFGAIATMNVAAQAAGLSTFMSEEGQTSWVPTGQMATDGNAYEGVGNCDWYKYDFTRQEAVVKALWASANGMTDISYFNSLAGGIFCAFGGPGNGKDKLTSTTYANNLANASSQFSQLFYFWQALVSWPFSSILPNLPLGI
jgi:hypothetical protein